MKPNYSDLLSVTPMVVGLKSAPYIGSFAPTLRMLECPTILCSWNNAIQRAWNNRSQRRKELNQDSSLIILCFGIIAMIE